MGDTFCSFRGSGVLLFDEDFDSPVPPPSPEPEIILPTFSSAELIVAREEAARESREATLAEVEASTRIALCAAVTEITGQIAASRDELASIAEQSSEAIAQLLLACFATAFPALSARHGPAEAAAVLREILPALHHEPKITVQVNPHLIVLLTEEFLSQDADLAARVRLIPTHAVVLGDARVTWQHGAATRDTASLWTQIESILAPAGLFSSADPLNTPQTAKEHDLVQ